jgi:hypothetical protein
MHPKDNPCEVGCGHGMIPNPWRNPFEAEADNDYKPSSCFEYDCICADSACKKTWGPGCVAVRILPQLPLCLFLFVQIIKILTLLALAIFHRNTCPVNKLKCVEIFLLCQQQ